MKLHKHLCIEIALKEHSCIAFERESSISAISFCDLVSVTLSTQLHTFGVQLHTLHNIKPISGTPSKKIMHKMILKNAWVIPLIQTQMYSECLDFYHQNSKLNEDTNSTIARIYQHHVPSTSISNITHDACLYCF